jgi:hypothetical protein
MISKKYANDYEIERIEDPNGKSKQKIVYKGKYFDFSASEEEIRATGKRIAIISAISWAAYLLPLWIESSAARTFLIIIPHAFLAVPLFLVSMLAWALLRVKPPLTREQNDRFRGRPSLTAMLIALFAGIASAGFLIRLTDVSSLTFPGDAIFFVCDLTLLFLVYLLFRHKERIASYELGG